VAPAERMFGIDAELALPSLKSREPKRTSQVGKQRLPTQQMVGE